MATKPSRATRPGKQNEKKGEEKKKLLRKDDDDDDDDDDHKNPHDTRKHKAAFKPKGGLGFRVEFEMPFRLKDVLRELSNPEEPLGFDKEASTVTIVRPGSSREQVFSPGFVRKTQFKNKLLGNTSSELMSLDQKSQTKTQQASASMTWRVLSADMPFAIKGNKRDPQCTIELTQERTWTGSKMAISWDYEFVQTKAPCCCIAPAVPCALEAFVTRALSKSDNVFKDQMVDRGYPDLNEQGATRLQALAKAFAVRRAEARRKANKQVYDDDDDDDVKGGGRGSVEGKPREKRGAFVPVEGGGVQATKPSRSDGGDTKPSRPQRNRPPTAPGGNGGASRPTRPQPAAAPKPSDDGPSTLKVIDDDD